MQGSRHSAKSGPSDQRGTHCGATYSMGQWCSQDVCGFLLVFCLLFSLFKYTWCSYVEIQGRGQQAVEKYVVFFQLHVGAYSDELFVGFVFESHFAGDFVLIVAVFS